MKLYHFWKLYDFRYIHQHINLKKHFIYEKKIETLIHKCLLRRRPLMKYSRCSAKTVTIRTIMKNSTYFSTFQTHGSWCSTSTFFWMNWPIFPRKRRDFAQLHYVFAENNRLMATIFRCSFLAPFPLPADIEYTIVLSPTVFYVFQPSVKDYLRFH